MHIDPYIVLGSAVVGVLVGLTGAGGGALMTPMLILLFGVKAPAAISSDLVAAVLMRPVGAAVHMRKGTVNYRLVGWLALGSVPMAFVGAYLLHVLGKSSGAPTHVEQALGAALLTGAAAMVIRWVMDVRGGKARSAALKDLVVKPVSTVIVGMIGGVIVGLTSVGSGSLMIVLLLFLYPMIGANRLVGTDLTQAVPLTLAAALGALIFGHVEFGVTVSIILGSVPAVLIGSLFSSRAPDKYIRPIIGFVIFASGLKYVGVPSKALGWTLGSMLLAAALAWVAVTLVRRRTAAPALALGGDGASVGHQAQRNIGARVAAHHDAAHPGSGHPNGAHTNGAHPNGAHPGGAHVDAVGPDSVHQETAADDGAHQGADTNRVHR